MKKKRIAVIAKNLRINGISNVIINYCTHMNLNEYEITIFAGNPICEEYVEKLYEKNIKFVELPKKGGISFLKYLNFVNKNIKSDDFDIVHIHCNSATAIIEAYLAKKNGIRYIYTHCHNTSCDAKIVHKLFKKALNKIITYGFCCSDEAGKWLYTTDNYCVLPNGFETKKFIFNNTLRDEVKNKLGLKDKKIIGHVGIFTDQKNHEFMLKKFEDIACKDNDVYLLFVGSGPKFEYINDLISKSKFSNRIICYGETSNVKELYDAMDVFWLPSKYEGLGIVLLEAQINGLNCVISDVVPDEAILNNNKVKKINLAEDGQVWANNLINYTKIKEREEYYDKNIKNINKYEINANVKLLESKYKYYMKGK